MSALDIREQQVDPAGSATPATVAPEAQPETGDASAEPGAAVAVAETQSASSNGTTGDAPAAEAATDAAPVQAEAATDAAPAQAEAAAADDSTPESNQATPDAQAMPSMDDLFGGDELGDVASLMEAFLANPDHDYKTLKYGDVMDGIIMHVDRDELLVDIGSKAEGKIPAKEYSDLTPAEKNALAVGDTILVFVVQPEDSEGHPVVSINRARQEKSWRRLQDIHEANDVIEAEVTNYNKGGLLVNLDGVRGFVPASQVTEIRGGDDASKQADMARLIGNKLPLKIIEINRHRNRLILSERQAIQERRDVMKEKLIAELKEGEIRQGRVSSICDFGAFVDIGGADGLVHLSELSWSRVRHPSELLKVGQEVDVYVLGINAQDKKIALSIKRTQAEPWSRVASKYEVGQLVRGNVTQLANFGAFARIEDGIEGLVHVSELADERITHPKQAVKEGQELLLRIIRIDPQRRRMGLSLRRALDTPDPELIEVFGEDALEVRDRIIEEIRTSLAAEGIDYQPNRGGVERPEIDTEPVSRPRSDMPSGEGMSDAGAIEDAVTRRNIENFQMPTERPQPQRDRRERRPERPAAQVEQGDAGMSAMELALAMAGVSLDEDNDTVTAPDAETNDESTDKS
ncbi:MAG TPA: 30S ribosomal protein S1 [Thermomicrobiales bacterium]|jgi:small subunit ribosomal protein S1|nr:30S ribosomal protein S1 [Thermomicrobiales bacterium]